ncbi:MAG: sulfate reduction electron transfer complex DsrMKJOP subunit DsrM [Desulfovibrionales bacterium]
MSAMYSLFLVLGLVLIALVGAGGLGWHSLFGVWIPAVAFLIFVVGFVLKVLAWGRSAVPFKIPTTCGQQETIPGFKQAKLDNPSSTLGVIGRMLLEVLFFRSLFRNTKMELHGGSKLSFGSAKWLWLGALAFHWSFLIIVLRHMRFFTAPVPEFVLGLEFLDGLLQVGAPVLYLTDLVILVAVTYLFLRRVLLPNMRYISLPSDYFPLLLILGIVVSGIFMRFFLKTDLPSIKLLTMGLVTFAPVVPEGIGTIFYVHLFLVSVLLIYFPMSKLMHMGGVFLSPTRNLANDTRKKRHINPWNYPVKVHTYEDYEDEFREKMIECGLPVDKE